MATKRSSKSNKTEHVLNLLSGTAQDGQESAQEVNGDANENAPQKRETVPVLEIEKTNHDNISGSINNALDDLLQKEMTAQKQAAALSDENDEQDSLKEEMQTQQEPVEQAISEQAPPKTDTQEQQPLPTQTVQNEEQKAVENETSAEEIAAKPQQDDEDKDIETSHITNVMEEVVERNIDDYINKFSVCKCNRCRADIKALALTKLPAKYVVLSDSTRAPMVSFYAGRYETQAKNEIIFACTTVKDKPRHEGFRSSY